MNRRKLVWGLAIATLASGAAVRLSSDLLPQKREEGRKSERRLQLAPPAERPPRLPPPVAGGAARSAVVLIGDGLGFAGIEAARLLGHGVGGYLTLDRLPVAGWSSTRSVDNLRTDSAAGATALATGFKTQNGRIGVDAEGRSLRNLVEAARAAGKAVGLVTDSYLWDATPAGFAVHNPSRRNTLEIALAMADQDIVFLAGCEAKKFAEDDADDGPVLSHFRERGYTIGHDLAALETAAPGKWIGLFPSGSLTPQEGESQLPRLVALALARLAQEEQGFLLLVETEETDNGGHANDLERVVRGVMALDEALAQVLTLAESTGDTLVVWTADHETGGLALLGGKVGEKLRHSWATDDHNAEPVPLLAYGPGAERFAGTHDNTEVARELAKSLGVELGGG